MKAYYEEKGITIYHGDCREILPSLPKVDAVITDPPYGFGSYEHDDESTPADSQGYPEGRTVRLWAWLTDDMVFAVLVWITLWLVVVGIFNAIVN